MVRKHIYLDESLIKWVDKQRAKEMRSFTNYLAMLIKAEMERKTKK